MIYRVSNVEAYRRWLLDEDSTVKDYLAYIQGDKDTEAMRKGTAFHKALEIAQVGQTLDKVEVDGYTFIFEGEFEIELAPIREWRRSKTYIVDKEPITISGQLDALIGKRIEDHKTTERFNSEAYFEGYQWRLYLDIFGCDVFRWNVFECEPVKNETKTYNVYGLNKLEQHRYPELGLDCQNMVAEFARFMRGINK